MSGWLLAGWLFALFIVVTVWGNITWVRMQRRIARQRPGLGRQDYVTEMAKSGVGETVAGLLYASLKPLCVKGVAPHPDDGLLGFYFDDNDDLEDLLEELHKKLNLPMPTRYEPEITSHLNSARDLAVYLQSRLGR